MFSLNLLCIKTHLSLYRVVSQFSELIHKVETKLFIFADAQVQRHRTYTIRQAQAGAPTGAEIGPPVS